MSVAVRDRDLGLLFLMRDEIEIEILQNFLEAETFDFGSETDTFRTETNALLGPYIHAHISVSRLYRLTWLTSLIHSI